MQLQVGASWELLLLASSPNFFCHLPTSHWRVFEAWATGYLCHMTLSQWRESSCQAPIGEFLRNFQDKSSFSL